VSAALAKAYAGQTTSLGKLVPGMDKAVLASGDMDAIMAELARTTGGSAAEAANTAAGQWKGFQIQMGEAQEAIGGALLPAMTALGASLSGVAGWVQENTTLFLVLAGIIGGVSAVILVLNVALKAYAVITKTISAVTKAWTAIQLALNASFLANPIFLVILGIVALIAAIALLWNKNEAFREAVIGAWEAIRAAAAAVWNWIVNAVQVAWNVIVSIGKAYIGVYVAIWNGIRDAAVAVWNWIVRAATVAWNAIVAVARTYISIYVSIFEGIKAAVGNVWDWLKRTAGDALAAILRPINAVRDAFDAVVDAIRDVIAWLGRIKIPDVLSSIGDVIGGLFSAPAPAAARSTGTAGLVSAGLGARAFGAAPTLVAGSRTAPTIIVQGALDPVAVARQIRQILTADDRRRGGVVIA
jgi:phage-related protein